MIQNIVVLVLFWLIFDPTVFQPHWCVRLQTVHSTNSKQVLLTSSFNFGNGFVWIVRTMTSILRKTDPKHNTSELISEHKSHDFQIGVSLQPFGVGDSNFTCVHVYSVRFCTVVFCLQKSFGNQKTAGRVDP